MIVICETPILVSSKICSGGVETQDGNLIGGYYIENF